MEPVDPAGNPGCHPRLPRLIELDDAHAGDLAGKRLHLCRYRRHVGDDHLSRGQSDLSQRLPFLVGRLGTLYLLYEGHVADGASPWLILDDERVHRTGVLNLTLGLLLVSVILFVVIVADKEPSAGGQAGRNENDQDNECWSS